MKREEALKQIRQWSLPRETREVLEALIPELRESEDERIRKFLLDYAIEMIAGLESDISRSTYNGIKGHDPESEAELAQWQKARAYLEKQKEYVSKKFDDVWASEDCEELIAEGKKLSPRFEELLKDVCHAWYDKGIEVGVKQKEQKVDIDKLRKDIYQSGYNDGYQHGKEDAMEEQKPKIIIPKFRIGEYIKPKPYNEKHLIKDINENGYVLDVDFVVPFKDEDVWEVVKQELSQWSEEDERVWQELIYFFTHDTTEWFPKRRISIASVVKFLKSLHPSWKPSEEQIYSLGTVVKGYNECTVGSVGYHLKEMYEHLKKLI